MAAVRVQDPKDHVAQESGGSGFDQVLSAFLADPSASALELGDVRSFECVQKIARRYSDLRRYRVHGQERSAEIFVKIYKNVYRKGPAKLREFIEAEYSSSSFWYDRLKSQAEFGTIRPLYHSVPHKAIVTEAVTAQNLGDLVRRDLRFAGRGAVFERLEAYAAGTGRLLRQMQSVETPETAWSLAELTEDIDLRMRMLVENPEAPFEAQLREAVLAFLGQAAQELSQTRVRLCYLHRDFMMANIMVEGSKLLVHDFTRLDVGPVYFDLTRFYHNLDLLKHKPEYGSRAVSRLQAAYLGGYEYDPERDATLFRCFLLRHYVTHFKGLVRESQRSLRARIYNRWVMNRHRHHINAILEDRYAIAAPKA